MDAPRFNNGRGHAADGSAGGGGRPGRQAFVGLGSDIEDRRRHLQTGLDRMARQGLVPLALSSIWETEGVDTSEPREFLNMVVRVSTAEPPERVLEILLGIERAAGRTRGTRNDPRTLDLDLLMIEDQTVSTPSLTLPHPRMWERRFVLEPLREIAPELRHPSNGRSIAEVCRTLGDRPWVRRQDRATTLLRAETNFYNGATL